MDAICMTVRSDWHAPPCDTPTDHNQKHNPNGQSAENDQLHPGGSVSKVSVHVLGFRLLFNNLSLQSGSCCEIKQDRINFRHNGKRNPGFVIFPKILSMAIQIGNIVLPDFPLLLAPMEDVSDPPFRYVCKQYGADLMYSEFISSEGLIRDAIKSRQKLDFFEYERPFGIQIFGGDEEAMGLSARIIDATNPDLVDINFGCPVKKVVCKGAGAAVLKDIEAMVRLNQGREAIHPSTGYR